VPSSRFTRWKPAGLFIARTGYTGEDGCGNHAAPPPKRPTLWDRIVAAGVAPCGLGARDTLRLEAGMNLYGSDMDETTTPLVSGLGWTVAWEPADRDFIGRARWSDSAPPVRRKPSSAWCWRIAACCAATSTFIDGDREIGQITSGTFSPTLNRAIALARVEAGVGERCQVDIRGKRLPARVVKPPFVRHGRALIE
jgi:aminomethyltransferase